MRCGLLLLLVACCVVCGGGASSSDSGYARSAPVLVPGTSRLPFSLPQDGDPAASGAAVFVLKRGSRSPQRWHLAWSRLEFTVTPREAPHKGCALEVLTDDLVPRHAHPTPSGALRLALSPYGRDAAVVVRCAPPPATRLTAILRALAGGALLEAGPGSASQQPSSTLWGSAKPQATDAETPFLVSVSYAQPHSHFLCACLGVALLVLAPTLARSVAAFYLGGVVFAATALALIAAVALARNAPGGRALRRAAAAAAAAAAVAPGLASLRERLVAGYLKTSLWPVAYLARAAWGGIHAGESTPFALLSAACLLVLSAAAGFFVVRRFLLDTSHASASSHHASFSRVLPGPALFVLVLLRSAAALTLLHATSDAYASALIAAMALALATGLAGAARRAALACGAAARVTAAPLLHAFAALRRIASAIKRSMKRQMANWRAMAAQQHPAAAAAADASLAPPVPSTSAPPLPSTSGTTGSLAGGMGVRVQSFLGVGGGGGGGGTPSWGSPGLFGGTPARSNLSEHACDPEPHQPGAQAPPMLAGIIQRRRRESMGTPPAASAPSPQSDLAALCTSPAFTGWLQQNTSRLRMARDEAVQEEAEATAMEVDGDEGEESESSVQTKDRGGAGPGRRVTRRG